MRCSNCSGDVIKVEAEGRPLWQCEDCRQYTDIMGFVTSDPESDERNVDSFLRRGYWLATDDERYAFNEWFLEMFQLADRVRDQLRRSGQDVGNADLLANRISQKPAYSDTLASDPDAPKTVQLRDPDGTAGEHVPISEFCDYLEMTFYHFLSDIKDVQSENNVAMKMHAGYVIDALRALKDVSSKSNNLEVQEVAAMRLNDREL